jgi:hypothetical protein
MMAATVVFLVLKLSSFVGPTNHNVVTFPVVRLAMTLSSAIYRDDYNWIHGAACSS